MRYIFVLLLVGCTATNWTKEGATTVDLDRDYNECQQITKSDPAIGALWVGALGAIGVFGSISQSDAKLRSCLHGRGWAAPHHTNDPTVSAPAATAATTPAVTPAAAMAGPLKSAEPDSPAAKRLRELKSLLDQGLITKEEYEERREVVLRGL
jgi:hypothetical protein